MTACWAGVFPVGAIGDVKRFAAGWGTDAAFDGLAVEPSAEDAVGGGGGGSVKIVRVKGFATEVRDTNCSKGDDVEVEEDEGTTGDALVVETEIAFERVAVTGRLEEEAADDVEGAIGRVIKITVDDGERK